MSTIPSFLLNAIIDDEADEVDIMVLVHGIKVLKNKQIREHVLRQVKIGI